MKKTILSFCLAVASVGAISSRLLAQPAADAGNALILNGANQYVEIPYDSAFSVGPFTYELWTRLDNPHSGPNVVLDLDDLSSGFRIVSNGQWRVEARMGESILFSGGPSSSAGTWVHLAVTYNGSHMTFFVNGNYVYAWLFSGAPSAPLRLGYAPYGDSHYFPGTIDEVKIWNHARTQSEIMYDMSSSTSPDATGLVAYWRFDEDEDTVATDLTGNGHNGVVYNDPSLESPSTAPFPSPYFVISSGSVDFGTVTLNTSEPETLTVTNTGATTLVIDSATSTNAYFSVTSLPTPVAPGGSASFVMTFDPETLTTESGTIVMHHNGIGGAGSVSVTGRGIAGSAGTAGNAFETGGSAYASIPYSADINPSTFTYELWARIDDKGTFTDYIFESLYRVFSEAYRGIAILVNTDWKVVARMTIPNPSTSSYVDIVGPAVIGGANPLQGVWTHLAITYDGGVFSFYVNGALVGSQSVATYYPNIGEPFRIGSDGVGDPSNFFHGVVDEFRVWNVARSQDQIIYDMTASLTGGESGLVGYWRFDESGGSVALDNTGHEHTMALSGGSLTSSGAGFPRPYFSGSTSSLALGKVTVGTQDTESVSVSNSGFSTLNISSIDLPLEEYSVTPASASISPGASQSFDITFTPAEVGGRVGTMVFHHDAFVTQSTVQLSGSGVDFQADSAARNALQFTQNGTSQVIQIPNDLIQTSLASQMTFETWIKVEGGQGTTRDILRARNSGNNPARGVVIFLNSSGQLAVMLGKSGNVKTFLGPAVELNTWTHIAFSATSQWSKLYVNGILAASGGGYDPNNMGFNYIGGFAPFIGVLDEIRFWNEARTADQILTAMNSSLAGNETGLAGYWRLDEQSGLTAVDHSGNLADGSLDDGYDNSTIDAMRISSTAPIPGASCIPRQTSFNFGVLSAGQNAHDTLWVVNFGTSQLVIDSLQTVPNGFSVSPASATIASSDSALFVVTFAPTSEGQYSDTLKMYHQAVGSSLAIPLTGTQLAEEPGIPSTHLNFSSVTLFEMTLRWTNGDGAKRIVLLKAGSAVDGLPASTQGYTANSAFGGGSQIGTGNFVVYDGSGDSVRVTGLTPGVRYYADVFEYHGSSGTQVYRTETPATGSQFTLSPATTPGSGAALLLDGVDDFVVLPNSSSLQITTGTLEAWIKTNDAGSEKRAIVERYGEYNMFLIDNYFAVYDWFSGTDHITTANLADNKWHHVAVSFQSGVSGGTVLYVDGIPVDTITMTVSNQNYAPTIGNGHEWVNFQNFAGLIDEVRIWNVARTPRQIREFMHRAVPSATTGLVGYWAMNAGYGTTAFDSAAANHGTLMNSPNWTASTAPVGPGMSDVLTDFMSGTVTLGGMSFTTDIPFQDLVDVAVTEVMNLPNSIEGISGNIAENRYWILAIFGSPGVFSVDLTFTLSPGDISAEDIASPANVKLYRRSTTADGSWTQVAEAASATDSTVTFSGITSFSQFTIGSASSPLPVQMSSFTASANRLNAELQWRTETEIENHGFEIERRAVNKEYAVGSREETNQRQDETTNQRHSSPFTLHSSPWVSVGFVQGSGTSSSPRDYSFVDKPDQPGRYAYRIKQIDHSGAFTYTSSLEVLVGLAPLEFTLAQNYPNPFNPTTTIEFTLPADGHVVLKIYDLTGREVATLVDEERIAGVHQQVVFDASRLASGMYFARLQMNGMQLLKKMVLVK